MSGKMNWDRVRKESLVRSHGSLWVGSNESSVSRRKKKSKKSKKKKLRRKPAPPSQAMQGCTCGKAIGFTGLHKGSCRLSRLKQLRSTNAEWLQKTYIAPTAPSRLVTGLASRGEVTLKEFVAGIRGINRGGDMGRFLFGLLKEPSGDTVIDEQRKKEAARVVAAMFKELGP